MTRKHYKLLAAAFAEAYAEQRRLAAADNSGDAADALLDERFTAGMEWGVSTALSLVGNALADDNVRFDKARFLEAARS